MRISIAAFPLLLGACAFGENPNAEEAARERNSVTVVQGLYDAFARGDIEAVLGTLTPDAEWTEAEGNPYPGTFRGPDAVMEGVFARLGTEWEGFRAVPSEFVADGNRVIALGTYSGTYRETGRSFQATFAHAWTVEGDRVTRFQQIADTEMIWRAVRAP